MLNKELMSGGSSQSPKGRIHFIASKDFSNVNFFQNITLSDPDYDFSRLQVLINDELTDQVASSISANADDDIKIVTLSGQYPFFGRSIWSSSGYDIDFIKSIAN